MQNISPYDNLFVFTRHCCHLGDMHNNVFTIRCIFTQNTNKYSNFGKPKYHMSNAV